MLTESFVAATLSSDKVNPSTNSALKDIGIVVHELQPQTILRHGYKKSSVTANCMAISDHHVFAAQADKAVINVYSREKGNQEATVPFPERIHSLSYVLNAGILVIGSEEGKVMLWEVSTGRLTVSAASHLQAVSALCVTADHDLILSGSADSSVHVWSLCNLVSLTTPSPSSYTSNSTANPPLRTFSNHRNGITALACGHSHFSTNICVSTSEDHICYIWRTSDCQVLRTILLCATPLCCTLDPADRAVYFGYENGHIQATDLYQWDLPYQHHGSMHAAAGSVAIQLKLEDTWSPPTPSTGQVNCLVLTYDGTIMLSGQQNGKVTSWDVSKGRFSKDIADLGQPVTNLKMLRPEGFQNGNKPAFTIPTIVKPRLELSARTENGTCGIPANYTLQGRIARNVQTVNNSAMDDDFTRALSSPIFTTAMLEEAVEGLYSTNPSNTVSNGTDPNLDLKLAKVERLEDQVTLLNAKVSAFNKYIEKAREKKLARTLKRDEVVSGRGAAYFEARKMGQDGDVAMSQWEAKERDLDDESDDDMDDLDPALRVEQEVEMNT